MRTFRKNLRFQGLSVSHRGGRGEVLNEIFVASLGTYALDHFSSKMTVSSHSLSGAKGLIEFESSAQRFSIEFPSDCIIRSNQGCVWIKNAGTKILRASLKWKNLPEGLVIDFPNGQSLAFSKCLNLPVLIVFPILIGLICFFCAAAVHATVLRFSRAAAEASIQSALQRRWQHKQMDLSKVEVTLAAKVESGETLPHSASENFSNAQVAAARNLLRSMGVGKPIADANHVLKASRSEQTLKTMGGSKKAIWDLDEDELKNAFAKDPRFQDLNLSESQIAQAFLPVIASLKDCYDDVLLKDPELSGKPEMVIDVNQGGQVVDVSVKNIRARASSIKSLRECFLVAYRGVHLPKPNRDFSVIQTLVLSH